WLIFAMLTPFVHGARMYRQYWEVFFPSVMILAGYGFFLLHQHIMQMDKQRVEVFKVFIFTFLCLGFIIPIYSTHIRGFEYTRRAYGYSKYPIFDYVRKHTKPTDRIFIWGVFYDLYTLSNRLPATPYLANLEFVGVSVDVPLRRYERPPIVFELFKKRFMQKKPKLIIDPSRKKEELIDIYGPFIWVNKFKDFPPVIEMNIIGDYINKYYEFYEEFDGFIIYKLKEGY
ncbi:MAG: hypothetical protein NC822_04650, partial [Candidatus Omnitrophica bacterium]|nr:hypothetical protein [Candidatus Omnitrophota bacterium]